MLRYGKNSLRIERWSRSLRWRHAGSSVGHVSRAAANRPDHVDVHNKPESKYHHYQHYHHQTNLIFTSKYQAKRPKFGFLKCLANICLDEEIRRALAASIPDLNRSLVNSIVQSKDNSELEKLSDSITSDSIVDALLFSDTFSTIKARSFALLKAQNPMFAVNMTLLAHYCNSHILSTNNSSSETYKSTRKLFELNMEESKMLVQSMIDNSNSSELNWFELRKALRPYACEVTSSLIPDVSIKPVLHMSIVDFNHIVKIITTFSPSEAVAWSQQLLDSAVVVNPTHTDTTTSNVLRPNIFSFKVMVAAAVEASSWENVLYFLSRMHAAGFTPDAAMYNKLIDFCAKQPATHWMYAKKFLLESAKSQKVTMDSSKLLTVNRQKSTLSSYTIATALNTILQGATRNLDLATSTIHSVRAGTATQAIEVIHTWNKLQEVLTGSVVTDTHSPVSIHNLSAVNSHTVGALGIAAVLIDRADLATLAVRSVLQNASKATSAEHLVATQGPAVNTEGSGITSNTNESTESNNSARVILSAEELLVSDLFACKTIASQHNCVSVTICILLRKKRIDLINKLWRRCVSESVIAATEARKSQYRSNSSSSRDSLFPFHDLLKVVRAVTLSVINLDVPPQVLYVTAEFAGRALRKLEDNTSVKNKQGRLYQVATIPMSKELSRLLILLFYQVTDYESASLVYRLARSQMVPLDQDTVALLLRLALQARDYESLFSIMEESSASSESQRSSLSSKESQSVILLANDNMDVTRNGTNKSSMISKQEKRFKVPFENYALKSSTSALYSPVLMSLADMNQADLVVSVLTEEMPRAGVIPSAAQLTTAIRTLHRAGQHQKGVELFLRYFERTDASTSTTPNPLTRSGPSSSSSSSSGSTLKEERQTKLLLTESAVRAALECCASGKLGALALQVLSTLENSHNLSTCAADARLGAGTEMQHVLLAVRALSSPSDVELLPQFLEIMSRQGTQKSPRLVTPQVLSSCVAATVTQQHLGLTNQIISIATALGYRLDDKFLQSVKEESALLQTGSVSSKSTTQNSTWFQIQDFIDTHVKPFIHTQI